MDIFKPSDVDTFLKTSQHFDSKSAANFLNRVFKERLKVGYAPYEVSETYSPSLSVEKTHHDKYKYHYIIEPIEEDKGHVKICNDPRHGVIEYNHISTEVCSNNTIYKSCPICALLNVRL